MFTSEDSVAFAIFELDSEGSLCYTTRNMTDKAVIGLLTQFMNDHFNLMVMEAPDKDGKNVH